MAFILFFIQAVAPIIPYMIIAGAAGMVFGYLGGFMLAWLGALAGAWFLYWLSKTLARDYFISLIKDKYDFDLKNIDSRRLFTILLISRIFPVVPTPIINIGSGISGVSLKTFIISSGLGKLPWAIIYVALGNYLMTSGNLKATLAIVAIILVVSFIGMHHYGKQLPLRRHRQHNLSNKPGER